MNFFSVCRSSFTVIFSVAVVSAAFAGGSSVLTLAPGESLDHVRDRARALPAADRVGGVEIRLPEGRFELGACLRLDKRAAGVTWRGAGKGKTVLTRSRVLSWGGFTAVSDPAVRARLDPSVRDRIVVCDLRATDVYAPVWKKEGDMPVPVPELFLDGERMPVAMWPNGADEWCTIEKILSCGGRKHNGGNGAYKPTKDEQTTTGGLFVYPGDRASRWTKAPEVLLWGYWSFDWWDSVIPVESIDTAKRTIRLKFPHTYGVTQGNPSPRRWKAVHLLEEIDATGEYYVDAAAKKLYFLPPRRSGRLSIAAGDGGFFSIVDTHDIAIRDMTLCESYGGALYAVRCDRLRLENLAMRNLRGDAVYMHAVRDSTVARCDATDLGKGGITVEGGDRKTLTAAHNVIEDCRVKRFARYKRCYANGIAVGGVGNTVRHCELADAPHQAMSVYGNNHVVEYCTFSNVVNSSDDAGAIYKGRNPSCRGNVIRHCLFTDVGSPRGHGTAAIYFDDGDVGETVYGCVFVRSGHPGKGSFGTVFVHGGFSNRVENCVFVDCKRAVGSAPWTDKHWREYVLAPLWQQRLLKDVDITKPPYIDRYPDFKGFMDPQPGQARDNLAERNVFVRCGEFKSGRWVLRDGAVGYSFDPGFVDAAHGDYTLRADSEVFKAVPGFKPIPFREIGPRAEGGR